MEPRDDQRSYSPDLEDGKETAAITSIALIIVLVVIYAGILICARILNIRERQNQDERRMREVSTERQLEHIMIVGKWIGDNHNEDNSTIFTQDDVAEGDIEAPSDKLASRDEDDNSLEEISLADSSLSSADPECAICLTRFKTGEMVCQSSNPQCTHIFHVTCMTAWLIRHPECPICRQRYLTSEVK